MCWREQFLTLCSSLMTYAGKGFVYVIIFSRTTSPKAVMVEALPASPRSTRTGAVPAMGPGSACEPLCRLSVPAILQHPPVRTPQLRLCISPTAPSPASRHTAAGGTCPASAARGKPRRNPALGAAPPSVRPSVLPRGEPRHSPPSGWTSRQF